MRRTLLAVGIALLISLVLAPHGYHRRYNSYINGWGPVFTENACIIKKGPPKYAGRGPVMVDYLVWQTAALGVLFALVVNLRKPRAIDTGTPTLQ